MTTDYKINGSATSIGPVSVQWLRTKIGTDHNGAPLYSQDHQVIMQFDGGSPTEVQQWLDNAVGGSVNLTTLNRWQLGFTTLSSVYMEVTQEPQMQDINLGSFTITVMGARVA